ncbi:MAG: hypothetical protein U0325_05335 [Polyangiales bacterium]
MSATFATNESASTAAKPITCGHHRPPRARKVTARLPTNCTATPAASASGLAARSGRCAAWSSSVSSARSTAVAARPTAAPRETMRHGEAATRAGIAARRSERHAGA